MSEIQVINASVVGKTKFIEEWVRSNMQNTIFVSRYPDMLTASCPQEREFTTYEAKTVTEAGKDLYGMQTVLYSLIYGSMQKGLSKVLNPEAETRLPYSKNDRHVRLRIADAVQRQLDGPAVTPYSVRQYLKSVASFIDEAHYLKK